MTNITEKSSSIPVSALEIQISRAERDLIEARSQISSVEDDDSIAVLFTGNHHDSFPRHLVVNDKLSPVEKTTWQVIRLSISDPNRPGSTPRRGDIAAMVNCSPPTITSSRTMLRIRRWMTYCRSVRHVGRFVGDIYLLNDEPLSLQATLDLDRSYIQFLELQSQSNSSKRHKQAADEVLAEIDKLETGTVPNEIEQLEVRTVRSIGMPGFGINQRKNFAPVDGTEFNQISDNSLNSGTQTPQSKNLSTDYMSQSKNFALDERKKFASASKKFLSSPGGFSSSSYINNKNNITASARDNELTRMAIDANTENPESPNESKPTLTFQKEISAWSRWGLDDPAKEYAWLCKHLPFLSYKNFSRYFLSLHAGRSSVIPAIKRKTAHLGKNETNMVLAQLLGKVASAEHGWSERIRDPIAYIHKLIQLLEKGALVPDEWGLAFLRAYQEQDSLESFIDSPDKLRFNDNYKIEY